MRKKTNDKISEMRPAAKNNCTNPTKLTSKIYIENKARMITLTQPMLAVDKIAILVEADRISCEQPPLGLHVAGVGRHCASRSLAVLGIFIEPRTRDFWGDKNYLARQAVTI